jgi:hypothetical protein
MELKLILVWIVGALMLLAGVWITSNLELTVGVTQVSYVIAMLASLVFFLLAGLCWIAVAVGTKSL